MADQTVPELLAEADLYLDGLSTETAANLVRDLMATVRAYRGELKRQADRFDDLNPTGVSPRSRAIRGLLAAPVAALREGR